MSVKTSTNLDKIKKTSALYYNSEKSLIDNLPQLQTSLNDYELTESNIEQITKDVSVACVIGDRLIIKFQSRKELVVDAIINRQNENVLIMPRFIKNGSNKNAPINMNKKTAIDLFNKIENYKDNLGDIGSLYTTNNLLIFDETPSANLIQLTKEQLIGDITFLNMVS